MQDKVNPLLSALTLIGGVFGGALAGHTIGNALTKGKAGMGASEKETVGALVGTLLGMWGGAYAGTRISDRFGWSETLKYLKKPG